MAKNDDMDNNKMNAGEMPQYSIYYLYFTYAGHLLSWAEYQL